jgi:hypothetical protein
VPPRHRRAARGEVGGQSDAGGGGREAGSTAAVRDRDRDLDGLPGLGGWGHGSSHLSIQVAASAVVSSA